MGSLVAVGQLTGSRRWAALVPLCVTLLVISLDTTVLNVALPSIVRDLHASSSQLQWVVDAYSLVFAGLLLSLGSLGDRLGRKWVFLAGLAVFAAGSAGSAFATSPDRLVITRACMGIGAAAIMPSTLSILANVFTNERDRAKAIGIWSGTTGLGVAAGPMLGGWLLAHFWWGSVFLINVPVALLGGLAAFFLVPNSKTPHPGRSDPVGAALSISGLALLLWGIIEAPGKGWGSPWILGALLAAAAILTGFVMWERHSSQPMLPMQFFRSRRFAAAIGAMALVIFGLVGLFFVITQWLQFALDYSPLQAGVRVGPIALVLLVVAPTSSLITRVLGTKPVVFAGLLLISIGLGLLSRTTVAGSYLDAVPSLLLLGAGTGLSLAPCIESVLGSLPAEQAGVGSATSDTSIQVGGALGVAVLGTALNIRYQSHLAPLLGKVPIPENVRQLILGSLGGAQAVAARIEGSSGAALDRVARQAFVSGMDLGLIIASIVAAVAAFVVLVVLPNRAPVEAQPS